MSINNENNKIVQFFLRRYHGNFAIVSGRS